MGLKFVEKNQMGQRYAKHQMQSGVKLYHKNNSKLAIRKWHSALRHLSSNDEKFVVLGYIVQAYCDSGNYELMLHYSLEQMELAKFCHDNYMRSEASLNLSKAEYQLAEFRKAINFAEESLRLPSIESRSPGYAYLTIALSHIGLSQFHSSLKNLEKAMDIAGKTDDKLLELQVFIGLATLFILLKDLNKAMIFLRNSYSTLQGIPVEKIQIKYKALIFYHLSVVLRLKGSLSNAREASEEAISLAQKSGNQSLYAKGLCNIADVNREIGETEAKETITRSWSRYEESFRIMRELKDRMGELIVLTSMAKSASESRIHYAGQCECQAIYLNKKCLELATILACKRTMMKCHGRLKELYDQLSDVESAEASSEMETALANEMGIFCDYCKQQYGVYDESLQALWCSHIFHERCLKISQNLMDGKNTGIKCPKCQLATSTSKTVTQLRTSQASLPLQTFIPSEQDENECLNIPSCSSGDIISSKSAFRHMYVGTSTTTTQMLEKNSGKSALETSVCGDTKNSKGIQVDVREQQAKQFDDDLSLIKPPVTTINRLFELELVQHQQNNDISNPFQEQNTIFVRPPKLGTSKTLDTICENTVPNCSSSPIYSEETLNYKPCEIHRGKFDFKLNFNANKNGDERSEAKFEDKQRTNDSDATCLGFKISDV